MRDAIIGSFYQGAEEVAYILLDNGTVQKVKGFDIFKQIGFTAENAMEGITDIVRLEMVVNAGGKRLPIAIDSNGNYYSLK